MRAYLIRRLLLIIPTLFLLSILVFLTVRFIPGDVIDVMLGELQWVFSGGGGDWQHKMENTDPTCSAQYYACGNHHIQHQHWGDYYV